MHLILAAVALTVAGLLVGVEFCVAVFVNPILDRLPGNNGLLGRSDGARVLGRVMPFWYSSAIVLAVAVAIQRGGGGPIAAAALFVTSIVMSIVLLVPINNRAKDWTDRTAPADWRTQLHRWDRWHYLRLAVITAAFVSLAVGVAQNH